MFAVVTIAMTLPLAACPWHAMGGAHLQAAEAIEGSAFDAPENQEVFVIRVTDDLRGTTKDHAPSDASPVTLPALYGYRCQVARNGVSAKNKLPRYELTCTDPRGGTETRLHSCDPFEEPEVLWRGEGPGGMTAVTIALTCI